MRRGASSPLAVLPQLALYDLHALGYGRLDASSSTTLRPDPEAPGAVEMQAALKRLVEDVFDGDAQGAFRAYAGRPPAAVGAGVPRRLAERRAPWPGAAPAARRRPTSAQGRGASSCRLRDALGGRGLAPRRRAPVQECSPTGPARRWRTAPTARAAPRRRRGSASSSRSP